jgi:hypothetical protein
MKIIALMLVKNEEWILPVTLKDLSRYIDDLVVLDDSDNDNSLSVIQKYGGHVIRQKKKRFDESLWRSDLLKKGRELGGTHFICLDADESFTNNFYFNFREIIKSLKPGQGLMMEWLCLWKSAFKIRFDNSIWVKNYKDFVYCDDQASDFEFKRFHAKRTPALDNDKNIKVTSRYGAVLHFQFVPFLRFQEKQAYYRVIEFLFNNRDALSINNQYSITNDNPKINTINIPKSWILDFKNLNELELYNDHYFLKKILNYFSQYGVKKFEALDIWHIHELRNFFINHEGRNPQPEIYIPSLRERMHSLKASGMKAITKYMDI